MGGKARAKTKADIKRQPLTDLQIAFCNEYIIDLNAVQAAIRAGYSKNTARMAHRIFEYPNVRNKIVELQQDRSKRTQITQDRVLIEIARIAFNDPRKAFDSNGDLLSTKEWPDEVAAAISSIKITDTKIGDDSTISLKEIKFWSKDRQLELAGKHLGMFVDKHDITTNGENINATPNKDWWDRLTKEADIEK